MSYFSRDNLLAYSDNSIFKLVILASRRAIEIAKRQPKIAGTDSTVKSSTIALEEIAEGKIQCKKSSTKE